MPFDSDRLARIDGWMNRYVEDGKYPGSSFLLAQSGEIVHRATTGMARVEEEQAFAEDTILRIYSMTKPVVSVAMMTLVEKGLLRLEAPVSDFIPEFGGAHALIDGAERLDQAEPCATPTVAQLATHTSGLTYSFNPGPLGKAYGEGRLDFPPNAPVLEEAAKNLAALPLAFQPGARWNYSVGIDVLGRIVEVVSGKTLDAFLAEEIFEPLGMKDTFFSLPDDRLDRFAHLYSSIDPSRPISLATPDEVVMHKYEDAEASAFRNATCFGGGGGLLSTIDDYFAFAEMIRKGGAHKGARILSTSTLAFMRRNHLRGDIASMGPDSFAEMPMEGVGFGIGGATVLDPALMRIPGNVGDFGWGGVASTYFWVDPVADLTCLFMTQLLPSSSYPNRAELKALVHGAMI